MGEDFFEGGTESIGPIGGKEGAGMIDLFIFKIGPDEVGEEGEIFLEEIDVEIARCVMSVLKNFEELIVSEVGLIGPLFEVGKRDGFIGIFFPPDFGDIGIGGGKGREAEGFIARKGDITSIGVPISLPTENAGAADAEFFEDRAHFAGDGA